VSKIKICFVDFWEGFNPDDNFFLIFLKNFFEVEVSKNPDFCIFSNYGYENLRFNSCIKIQFVGENVVPDFNLADYAMGFHHLYFDDRYFRLPLYYVYGAHFIPEGLQKIRTIEPLAPEKLLNRKFCNFVYSNASTADPIRRLFFEQLSRYKKVDAGGKYLNNIGYQISKKLDFIKDYKFTIAFENSVCEGYTTEKIFEPMVAKSMPIYYGNPLVNIDFNPESFIWMRNEQQMKSVVEEIIRLDLDDNAYLEKMSKPYLTKEQLSYNWELELEHFLKNIITKGPNDKRTPEYGFNQYYSEELRQMTMLRKNQMKINKWKALISDISVKLKLKSKKY
jgi:alpha(1,3/1,4) fucosyltransferase